MVVWFIGISGSGKTTQGERLKKYCDKIGKKAFILDGDWIRSFYDNDLGYSKKERHENIKRIILSAFVLSENGIITIVCNISPFESLRDFCRKKIQNYNEIYLKRSVQSCEALDVKEMYKTNKNKTQIVGKDFPFETPKHSDLVIEVDKHSIQESSKIILNYLKNKYPGEFK